MPRKKRKIYKSDKPFMVDLEERKQIIAEWEKSRGKITYTKLSEMFNRSHSTVKRIIQDYQTSIYDELKRQIREDIQPDMEALKKMAWEVVVDSLRAGDTTMAKAIINDDLKTMAKRAGRKADDDDDSAFTDDG